LTKNESDALKDNGRGSYAGLKTDHPQKQIVRIIQDFLADQMDFNFDGSPDPNNREVTRFRMDPHRIQIKGIIEGESSVSWMFYVHIGFLVSHQFQEEMQNPLLTAADWSATYHPCKVIYQSNQTNLRTLLNFLILILTNSYFH